MSGTGLGPFNQVEPRGSGRCSKYVLNIIQIGPAFLMRFPQRRVFGEIEKSTWPKVTTKPNKWTWHAYLIRGPPYMQWEKKDYQSRYMPFLGIIINTHSSHTDIISKFSYSLKLIFFKTTKNFNLLWNSLTNFLLIKISQNRVPLA